MSIDLMLEVMDHAPADLTSGERLVLVIIAERANEATRVAKQSKAWTVDTIASRAGVSRDGLRKIFQRLAKNNCEVRQQLGTDSKGRPVFAYEGTAMTFEVPQLAERRDGSTTSSSKRRDRSAPSHEQEEGPQSARGGTPVPQRRDRSTPQSLMTLKEPSNSSLSSVEPTAPASNSGEPSSGERRGNGDQKFKSLPHKLIAQHGITDPAEVQYVIDYLTVTYCIDGDGWWITANRNRTLPMRIQEALADYQACGQCRGTGKVEGRSPYGDYETIVDCPACTKGEPADGQPDFIRSLRSYPECPHRLLGGNVPKPDSGWMLCRECRKEAGWVDTTPAKPKFSGERRAPASYVPPGRITNSRANVDEYKIDIAEAMDARDRRNARRRPPDRYEPYKDPDDPDEYERQVARVFGARHLEGDAA
ncbi:hypothetical protein [Polymorphospora sp. A560]|uniref:hypothetical protein n=1 Tax=Polymorphospora sp. A560 TaxID=3040203 RepID=UPI003891DF92